MENQNIVAMNTFKTHRDSRILHSRTAKKTWQIMWRKRIFKWQPSKLLWIWIFGAVTKVTTTEKNYYGDLGRLLWSCLKPPAGFAEREKRLYWRLDCCTEWLHSLYFQLFACYLCSSCRINKPQLSIGERLGEWLRDHEQTTLVFFRSWSRYFSSMYFHVFFDKLSNKLLRLFWLFVFPDEIAFSSILRNKLKWFASGAILSFAKKNLS